MAYFLRKHNKKRGIYLQVLFSYRDPESGKPKNKSVISPGYVSDLIDSGIPDPITFYSEYVKNLNDEYRFRKNEEKRRLISERPALFLLPHSSESLRSPNRSSRSLSPAISSFL